MKLGETILKLRTQKGMSQEKLAELVGVSRQAVSKWEVGDATPDTDKLIPLARALGVSVDRLLGNEPEEDDIQRQLNEPVIPPTPEKKPGWFATHWYWLGLIPVAWGVWQLLWLLFVVLGVLGNIAYFDVGYSLVDPYISSALG